MRLLKLRNYYIITFLGVINVGFGFINQCGNSACCQSGNYGPSFSGPFSIFNVDNIGYGQPYSIASNAYLGTAGCARRRSVTTCLNIDALPFTFQDIFCNQPVYMRILQDTPISRTIDSMCTTNFPLPDNPDSYITYISYVYATGVNEVMSAINTYSAVGTFTLSTAATSFQHKFFASAGNLQIACTRAVYSNPIGIPSLFASTYDLTPLNPACISEVSQIVACSGLPDPGLYILPFKFPPKCIIEQPSTLNSTFLSTINTMVSTD